MSAEKSSMELVKEASKRLDQWIEGEHFKGWSPYDGMNSPVLNKLSFHNRLMGIFWVQLLKLNPINLRPLLRIKKDFNPKGMGLFLSSYLRKYSISNDERYLELISLFSFWLQAHISNGYSGACWGYNFDWPNRGFFAPKGTPTIVNTAFIGLGYLDVYSFLEEKHIETFFSKEQLQNPANNAFCSPVEIARSACDFILNDLNQISPQKNEVCFSYSPIDTRWVHNANVMGAMLLAAVYRFTREPILAEFAEKAFHYTIHRQRNDGSWPYGEASNDRWADNYHTGFVLVALKSIATSLGIKKYNQIIWDGYQYYKEHFFLPDGTPKFYNNKIHPIDTHCIAQGILTFLAFSDVDRESIELSFRVAIWGIKNMQDTDGFFHYQIRRMYRNRIPYMRWSQAWMQRALIELVIN